MKIGKLCKEDLKVKRENATLVGKKNETWVKLEGEWEI